MDNMMNKFETLEKTLCRELENIEQKARAGAEMSIQDLDRADKLAHAMKSIATYRAMKVAEEYESDEKMSGMSGYRGRALSGKFVSRDDEDQSYAEGYSRGYAEGRNQSMRMSGHYDSYYPPYERYR